MALSSSTVFICFLWKDKLTNGIVTDWPDAPPSRLPWVTIGVLLVCTVAKTLLSSATPLIQQAILELAGVYPSHLAGVFLQPIVNWMDYQVLSLFSALFIHTSWVHLTGNMVYLWVFGVPLERRLGRFFMLVLFLIGGALANLVVSLHLPDLTSPIVGASGAISAVVGAYLGLFPSRRIGMLLPLGLYLQFARVPGVLVIGSWFTLQLVYTVLGPITGVVAWWTHMAGFALGLIFALLMRAIAWIKTG